MNILEAVLVHKHVYLQKNLDVIISFPCRGPSPNSGSAARTLWKPLSAEALPARPAAAEPPIRISAAAEIPRISAAVPGVQWQLSKPGLQARCPPRLPVPAPRSRPKCFPTGGRVQEASTAPPSSQVSALELGRVEGGVGLWAELG